MLSFLDTETLYDAFLIWESGEYNHPAEITLFSPGTEGLAFPEGLEAFLVWARSIRFSPAQIQELGALREPEEGALFNESFLNYLQRFTFQCEVKKLTEGTLLPPGTPFLKIRGPMIQVRLVRTALLQLTGGTLQPD